jgi:F-type H+-transporting ATPase subunit b
MTHFTKTTACLWGALLLVSSNAFAAGDAHGDAAGHAKSAGLPQFDPSSFPSQVFWLAVVFIILYIFFSKKTLPEISKVIENRTEHIQNDLSGAASLKKEAEEVHEAYEAILDEARQTSLESFSAVELAIKDQNDKASDDFRKRSAKDVEKTEASVEKAKAKVLADIDSVAAQVARDAAEKIIGVKTDLKQAESIVQTLQGKNKKKKAA